MSDADLVVPFMMREWMRKVEEYCDKVDAYLTEVELRLVTLENDNAGCTSCNCHPDVPVC